MDFDPRDYADSRDRDDDGLYGSWLDQDTRDRHDRDVDPREQDPRDTFVEGLDRERSRFVQGGYSGLNQRLARVGSQANIWQRLVKCPKKGDCHLNKSGMLPFGPAPRVGAGVRPGRARRTL